jgi:hypothetical protein
MLPQLPADPPTADAAASEPQQQQAQQHAQQQQSAVAVEQFMQSAPLGEYSARLALLDAFRWSPLPLAFGSHTAMAGLWLTPSG